MSSSLCSSSAIDADALSVRETSTGAVTGPAGHGGPVGTVQAMLAAGRPAEAAKVATSALDGDLLPADVAGGLRLSLSTILFLTGDPRGAIREAEAVLSLPELPEDLYARAELNRLYALLAVGDPPRVRMRAEAVLAGGDQCSTDATLAGALTALGLLAWEEGRAADSLGLLLAGVRRGDLGPGGSYRAYPRLAAAVILTSLGEPTAARNHVAAAQAQLDGSDEPGWAAAAAIVEAHLDLSAGRVDEAEAGARAGLHVAERVCAFVFVPMARYVLAAVAIRRNDRSAALRMAEGWRVEPRSGRVLFAATAYAWLDAYLGDDGTTSGGRVDQLVDGCLCSRPLRHLLVERPTAAAWVVRRALAMGDHRRAVALVDCARQLALQNQEFPTAVAAALHAGALVDRDAEALEQAALTHRRPWDRASAFEDAGTVRAETGVRDAAARAFEQALASYEDAGARPDIVRVGSRLDALHDGRRPPRRADRPLWGWESLTEAEHRVADLVAEGLTNPQTAERLFLSRHTVDFHLRQIFRKLEVASRVALTRVVLAHQNDT